MAKRRRSKQQHTTTIGDLSLNQLLADAALLGSLFTVLSFHVLRLENFESEKYALLIAMSIIMIGSHIPRLFQKPLPDWRAWFKNPVVRAVTIILIVSGVSTVLSLSPTYSWMGKLRNPNGMLALLIYALIFFQSMASARRLAFVLIPFVTVTSLLISFWSILSGGHINVGRSISTSGNANYLSSWMAMVIVVLLFEIYRHIYAGKWREKRGYILFQIGVIALSMFTFLTAGGRGGLLSLIAAVVGLLMIIAVYHGNRRVMLIGGGIIFTFAAGYIVLTNAGVSIPGGSIFRVGDSGRYLLWDGGMTVVEQSTSPLERYDGEPDALAGLRPIIGYGPEMVYQTQIRYGESGRYKDNISFSFHNHILDMQAQIGLLGNLAWMLVYGSVVYIGLSALHLITRRQIPLLILFAAAGIALLLGVFSVIEKEEPLRTLVGLAVGLGLVVGLYAWIFLQLFWNRAERQLLTQRQILLLFMMSAVVAHWIDIQFAFSVVAAEPLFWFILGMFAAYTVTEDEEADVVNDVIPANSYSWQLAVVGSSLLLMTIYSAIFYTRSRPSAGEILVVIALLMGAGWLGIMLSLPSRERKANWWMIGMGFIGVIIVAIAGEGANQSASGLLDGAGFPRQADGVMGIFLPMTASTIISFLIIIAAWIVAHRPQLIMPPRWMWGWVAVILVFAFGYYAVDFTLAAMNGVGSRYIRLPDVERYDMVSGVYDQALALSVFDRELHLHAIYAGINYVRLTGEAEQLKEKVDEHLQAILDGEPYFMNVQYGWQLQELYQDHFGIEIPHITVNDP